MQLESKLQNICNNVDGSIGAFFCGYDGMIIAKYEQRSVDIDYIAASFATVIKSMNNASSEKVIDIFSTFTTFVIAIHISKDGFLGILLSKDGNLGRAKLELTKAGGDFLNAQ